MASLESGQIIDNKYRVGRLLGEGGMGAVYEGEHMRIARRVAIKVLHGEAASKPEIAARFQKEARAAARIGSKHICDVLDLGDLPNGDSYLVMEFLDGEDLEARLKDKKKLPAIECALIAYQLLDGLSTMHDAGIIHRDLKPANVFLSRASRGEIVKILDFGVSKFKTLRDGDSIGSLTATGAVMGTPLYMSPEQARGSKELDGRSDLYAVAVILYKAVSGYLPFAGDNFNEILFKIALEDPRPIEDLEPELDPEFVAIIKKGMARDAKDRFQDAREFQDAVRTFGVARGLTLDTTHSIPPPPGPAPASQVDPRTPGTPVRILRVPSNPNIDGVAVTATSWSGRERRSQPNAEEEVVSGTSDTEMIPAAPESSPLLLAALDADRASQTKRRRALVGVGATIAIGAAVAIAFVNRPATAPNVAAQPSASVASSSAPPPPAESIIELGPNAPSNANPPAANANGASAPQPKSPTSGAPSASSATPPSASGSAAASAGPIASGAPATSASAAPATSAAASAASPAASASAKPAWGPIAPTIPEVMKKDAPPATSASAH